MAMESPFKADILRGKVALLTGGGSGIGFEISTQFGKHGAAVSIMGRRRDVLDAAVAELKSQGIQAIGLVGDVRKQGDAARVVEETFKHFGRLDILVNGAAGNFLASPEDLSPNGFRTVLDIDSVGTYTMCHEALKYLKIGGPGKAPSTGGLILNISATLHYTASWYQIHVSAAKAAVDSITRSLALEWGTDYDIRVNGIAPGPIEGTPGMRKLSPDEMKSKTREYMPLYKLGERWDIAMAALYLASDAEGPINDREESATEEKCGDVPMQIKIRQNDTKAHEEVIPEDIAQSEAQEENVSDATTTKGHPDLLHLIIALTNLKLKDHAKLLVDWKIKYNYSSRVALNKTPDFVRPFSSGFPSDE